MKDKYNFYDYEIETPNGEKTYFKGTKNNNTKEINLACAKSIFKDAKLSGRIINQEDTNEQYIFINGNEILNRYVLPYTSKDIETLAHLLEKIENEEERESIRKLISYCLSQLETITKTLNEKGLL